MRGFIGRQWFASVMSSEVETSLIILKEIVRDPSTGARDDRGKAASSRGLIAERVWRDDARFSSWREQAIRGLAKFCARAIRRSDAAMESNRNSILHG